MRSILIDVLSETIKKSIYGIENGGIEMPDEFYADFIERINGFHNNEPRAFCFEEL